MIRSIQAFSFLSRLRPDSVLSPVSSCFCRCASRSAKKPWMEQRQVCNENDSKRTSKYSHVMSEEELETEDVEDKIQALVNQERKKQKTVKYHILRRQMTPAGAPKRKLSWEAIEQIRYLKKEQPEEWTVQHLAEGFSVAPDVVLRVLRSKFVPTVERRAQQDAKIKAELGQKVLHSGPGRAQDRLKLPGKLTPAALLPGKEAGAVVTAEQMLVTQDKGSASLVTGHTPASLQRLRGDFSDKGSTTAPRELERATDGDPTEEDEEECWDGRVLTEDDLEEFMEMEKASFPVQMGKDFFDAEGNFLYRI